MSKDTGIATRRSPETKGEIVTRWVIRLFLLIWTVLIIFPLLWAIMTSFKSQKEFMADAFGWPQTFLIENYAIAWKEADFSKYFLNSVILSVGTVVLTILFTLGSSYVIAKYRFKLFRFLDHFYSIFMMVPQMLLLVPLLKLCQSMHLTDSWTVIPTLMLLNAIQGVPFYVFLTLPFMRGLNNDILEAAEIDGTNEFQRFFHVVLPMVKPPLFIVSLLSFAGIWNEYAMSITFIKDPNYYTLSAGLNNLMTDSNFGYGVKFAALIISMLPILVMYAIFQKPLQNGLSASDGVKG